MCARTSAWARVTFGFLCRWRRLVLRSSKAAHYPHRNSVLQKNLPFSGAISSFTAPGTGPEITSRFRSSLDVQVSRKISMSSTAMCQRMVWVDLEVSHRAKVGCCFLNDNVTVYTCGTPRMCLMFANVS